MISKASALIYTREKYIGFPGGWFKVQPEDFSQGTADLVMKYAMSAMEDVKPLRSAHKQVCVVIAEHGYVVLGIAAYLRDLFSDGWEGIDEKNRPIYGFIGFVWKQNDFTQAFTFPTLNEFTNLVSEHVRPNWELSKNASWATQQELVSYHYSFYSTHNASVEDFAPARIESIESAERLVQWAIQRAANGETVSVCTNVTIYDAKDYKTPFQYVSQAASGKQYGSTGSTGRNSSPASVGGRSGTSSTGAQEATHGASGNGSTSSLNSNGGSGPSGGTSTQIKNASKIVPVAMIAFGIVFLILALISLPVAWAAGLLWKVLLVVSAVCLAVGVMRLMKVQQKSKQKLIHIPDEPASWQQTTAKIDTNLFKTATKIEKSPDKATTPKVKRFEDETTEDLFKF